MNEWQLEFHHLGLAVHSPEMARVYLKGLGYTLSESIYDPLQAVNLQMAEHTRQPNIELVWPGNEISPLDGIIKGQQGIIYHTCFVAINIEHSLEMMQKQGLRVITVSAPKPAVLFSGRLVSFYMVRGFGLIEVLHEN